MEVVNPIILGEATCVSVNRDTVETTVQYVITLSFFCVYLKIFTLESF